MTPQHKDPILEEIWQIREALAEEANYDLDAICKRHMEEWGMAEVRANGKTAAQ